MAYRSLRLVSRFLRIFLLISLIAIPAYSATVGNVPKHIIFKGLNTKGGPLSLDDGESPDCLNTHTNIFGTLLKRSGYSKLNSAHNHVTTSPGKVNGLFDYAVDSATSKLMGYFDNELYKMDSLDGAFDAITDTVGMTNNIMEFTNFDGTLLFTTWSRDALRFWAGSASSTTHVQITPAGKHLINAYNRVFLGDIVDSGTTYELRFYFSNAGSYTTWTTSTDYETLDAPSGDRLMGFGLLKGRLFGLSKYTVSLISDVGGASPIEITRRVDGTGCGAPRSLKTINHPRFGEALVWLTNDKRLVLYTGSSLADISEKVYTNNNQSPFAMELINTAALEKSHAVVYEKKGWYVLFVPISANIDYALKYDYKTDTLWPDSNQNFESSAVVETTTGNFIYAGDRTGGVFKLDTGNDDDGTNINGYWTSRKWDFGFMPAIKKMGEIRITTKTIGNYDLKYQYRYNWDTSWSTAEDLSMTSGGQWLLGDNLPATLGGRQAQSHRLTIPGAFNTFQIKLTNNTNNPSFEVYGMDVVTNVTGGIGD